tara:strand:- start:155 stop:898 length:744 start_codon:yes stop_codon:yes gene_type:complete
MILPGSTAFTKTLGQQSDAIVTANLTGEWKVSTGVETAYWDNQVSSGNNLRRLNGIAKTNSGSLHWWAFDGSDDYLGVASSGYGGDAFQVNINNAFTIGQWFKNNSGQKHIVFNFETGGLDAMWLEVSNTTSNKASLRDEATGELATYDFTFADDTWYYVTITYDGTSKYTFYVNGSYIATTTYTENIYGLVDLVVGKMGSDYTASTIKVGHLHVYSATLTNSQVRQNFLATHSINNSRLYGATYTA